VRAFIISGNHDSPERIAFGSKIMSASGIHLSPVYDGMVAPITLTDEFGELRVYMLPFVKPSHVRRFYEDESIDSYTDALRVAVENMQIDVNKRNVLVTHQFVTGATRSESEETVGGTDNVDAVVFDAFDYVALGHLHGAQSCGKPTIRYSGTPLKYSFAEADDEKSVTVLTFLEKGKDVEIRTVALTPIRDMRKIKGKFAELTAVSRENNPFREDYVQITLTDEDDIPDAMQRLQLVYKNALNLRYDNARTRAETDVALVCETEKKSAFDLFSEFYASRNGAYMSETQLQYMKTLIEGIEGEEV
jgi:exonuclease SbcD